MKKTDKEWKEGNRDRKGERQKKKKEKDRNTMIHYNKAKNFRFFYYVPWQFQVDRNPAGY